MQAQSWASGAPRRAADEVAAVTPGISTISVGGVARCRQLQRHAAHTVNAGVSAGNQRDGAARLRLVQGKLSAFDFLAQVSPDQRLAGQPIGDQVEIAAIADDDLGAVDGRGGVEGDQSGRARPESDHEKGSAVRRFHDSRAYQHEREIGQAFSHRFVQVAENALVRLAQALDQGRLIETTSHRQFLD